MLSRKRSFSFISGFLLLFTVYHLPEFFDAFWIMAVCRIGFLILAFFLARWQGWKGLGGYGLPFHAGWWKNLLPGILLGMITFAVSQLIALLLHWETLTLQVSAAGVLQQLPILLLFTFFPSMAEDILTRGYLHAHLRSLGAEMWIVCSALVFTGNHIWRLNNGAAVICYLLVMGLVLAYAVRTTGSLWLAFGIHWGLNIAYQFVSMFFKSRSLTTGSGPTWVYATCLAGLGLVLLAGKPLKWAVSKR